MRNSFYDYDDDEYSIQVSETSPIAIAPVLPTEEPDNSLNIDYVEASPLDSKLVILEEVKDEILHAKLLKIHLFIDKIESLNNNPTPDCLLNDHTEETSSGSTTTHADDSLPEYDSYLFEIEPNQGELSSVALEAILGEPHVYVPNVLPTSQEEISISFIRDPLYPVFNSLLSFSSENEDEVFKPGILSYLLVSHQDKTTSDYSENPMMMYGGDIPLLDISYKGLKTKQKRGPVVVNGGLVVVNGGPVVVNDGPPPETIVDRHHWPSSLNGEAATWHINHELQVQYEEEGSVRGVEVIDDIFLGKSTWRKPIGGSGLYSLAIETCTKKLLVQ
nr:hypothetical protein [Tanacetum cinerariifolium]